MTNSLSGIKNTRRTSRMRRILYIVSAILLVMVIYAITDYFGPKKINLKPGNAFGLPCYRARGLIVQEYDMDGNLWATRGMIVYKLNKESDRFIRIAHIPTGPSLFWLRNFSILRRLSLRPECIEMVVTANGDICALSAGRVYHYSSARRDFTETLKLSHYGFGDQGMRNDGIVCVDDSVIYFGEYFQNPEKTAVRIYTSKNGGKLWDIANEFQPGQIRHIHAVQKDPYDEKLWVCTGDMNEESIVAYSGDDFKTLIPIGQGSQMWRVCQLAFTDKAVYWGTDTGEEDLAGIYKWDRETKEITKLQVTDGAMFFAIRLAKGTIVMSTDREGMRNEKDDRTRIWITDGNDHTGTIVCGTWKHKKPGIRYKYAMLRFQRDQGSPDLAITCLNQKEFPDGELLIVSEDDLLMAAKKTDQY